jgi:preprotein translocase subunit SecD
MANDTSSYYLLPAPLLTSANVTAVDDMNFMDETPGLLISFDAAGTKQWEKVTGIHVGDFFAIILDDTLLTVGANTAKISTGKAFFPLPNRSNAELKRIKEVILTK